MTAFAEGTSVSEASSQQEIVKTLKRYGASGFMFGEDRGNGVVAFSAHGRTVRFVLPLTVTRSAFQFTDSGRHRASANISKLVEGERRRRWRALALAIKAKLEVVNTGISTFEEEFLSHIVLPDNSTVGEFLGPQLDAVYRSGEMPELIPSARRLEIEA